ncbi:uncharacterized protein N7483_000198 [Penicillium malachiteum]|uniref:uncharacterized protein n=1 Tax=Penicillium malachiteum TaxID=1324776 RepID=UPI002547A740|nr:uncharacterized protein N7483_000198 [Penicillium malachiteum]KAJ5735073.1 hypothetical protein N7483_000198 [Penicillium malachiteum]
MNNAWIVPVAPIDFSDFNARSRVAFMHRAEYRAALGYANTLEIPKAVRRFVFAAHDELNSQTSNEVDELWKYLLMQRPSDFHHVDFFGTIRGSGFDFSSTTNDFNRDQTAAFTELSDMPGKFVALEGPPGTGKTLWASRILVPLVQNKNEKTGNKHQILAIAATNEQTENLFMRIEKTLREEVQEDKEPAAVRRFPWSYVESNIEALQDVQNADVVVTTQFASCQQWIRESLKPSHIIIDGASQIAEPLLWPNLVSTANNANFVAMILIGDHLQVPRVIMENANESKFKVQLEMSYFHRLVASGLCLTILRQQRRMHGDIAACPKHLFYGSFLTTHFLGNEKCHNLSRLIRLFNNELFKKKFNVVVIDNPHGKQKVDDNRGSNSNEKNAQAVVSLVTLLLIMLGNVVKPSNISILTFYNAQKQLHERNMQQLQQEKPELNADKIRISTVDSFQGNEADIVVLDFVVTDKPGFVTDKRTLGQCTHPGEVRLLHDCLLSRDWQSLRRYAQKQKQRSQVHSERLGSA